MAGSVIGISVVVEVVEDDDDVLDVVDSAYSVISTGGFVKTGVSVSTPGTLLLAAGVSVLTVGTSVLTTGASV